MILAVFAFVLQAIPVTPVTPVPQPPRARPEAQAAPGTGRNGIPADLEAPYVAAVTDWFQCSKHELDLLPVPERRAQGERLVDAALVTCAPAEDRVRAVLLTRYNVDLVERVMTDVHRESRRLMLEYVRQ